jgi:hypothetical protein
MATIISDGFSELLTLYIADFKRLLEGDEHLRGVIEQVAGDRAMENINQDWAKLFPSIADSMLIWTIVC